MARGEVLEDIWIAGTPRTWGTWGNRRIEDEWIAAMHLALAGRAPLSANKVAVKLRFLIFPDSPKYRGQMRPHGPDLDNLVKLTIDGLTPLRGRGTAILAYDRCVYRIEAEKELVGDDDETGVWLSLHTP